VKHKILHSPTTFQTASFIGRSLNIIVVRKNIWSFTNC